MLAALLLPVLLSPQGCTDPATPGGGFTVTSKLNRLVTFSDGKTTRADIRHPSATAGACGWPVLVFVHGMGGDRSGMATIATEYAQQGYLTIAYDVRGHATATGLHTHYGLRERIDLGETLVWLEATFPGLVDSSRIGVNGTSQGGLHAWMAAVSDGRPYPANPWNAGSFPDIDAVVAENSSPDFRATFTADGLAVNRSDAFYITHGTADFDPTLHDAAVAAFLAEDWAAWTALVSSPGTHDLRPEVPAITCPTMAMIAYDDRQFGAATVAECWSAIAPRVPRKLYLGTGGHSSPVNNGEIAFRAGWRRAWFDRFLKGIANGIEASPAVEYAWTPDDPSAYQSATSTWAHATADTWPPPGGAIQRLYLHVGQALLPTPPVAPQPADVLTQTVAPGYGMAQVVAAEFVAANVLANIPRNTLSWESDPLPADLELVGSARMRLAFDTPDTRWQVRARLCDVAPASAPRLIAGGTGFAWDTYAPGQGTLEIEIAANAYVFRAGHRIRLELENLSVLDFPGGPIDLAWGPYTREFTLGVEHGPDRASFLELPVRACPVAVPFGAGILNSAGCTPSISGSGVPSVSSPLPFVIGVSSMLNRQPGLLLYGLDTGATPFYGGTLYVAGAVSRIALGSSGGNTGVVDCSGSFAYDFNARIRSGLDPELVAGRAVCAQVYYRDAVLATDVGLSDALLFLICP